MMNKKGSILDMFIFISLAIAIVLVLGLFLYGFDFIRDRMGEQTFTVDDNDNQWGTFGNMSNESIGVVVDSFESGFPLLAFAFIFGMIMSIFITGFFVRSHPIFLVIYIFVTILAVIVSVPISNFYETQLSGAVYSSTLGSFTAVNYILLYLPVWVAVIGIFGMIFLFIFLRTSVPTGESI